MNQKGYNIGITILIWVRAFGIALLLLVILFFFMNVRDKKLEIKNPVGGLFYSEHFTNNHEKRLDFYFLGSSLTNNALIQYISFDSLIAKKNVGINYKAAICGGACLQDFNNLIVEIKQLRPRYLFIESNTACLNMGGINNSFNFFAIYRTRLARFPEYLFGMGTDAFQLINNPVPKAYIEEKLAKSDFDNRFSIYEKFGVRSINEFQLWSSFYKEAASLGIKIYLLEFPRSIEAEQHFSVKFKDEYKGLIQQYKAEYNIDYIGFPDKRFQNKYFLDGAHFNKFGGDYYCELLMNEIFIRKLIYCN